jgi:methionyl-tRNA synthetase
LHEYLEDFPNREDELRYVLTSIAPETKDSEFTWKDYQTRINSELVSIFGNFVNRVLVLCDKYYEGVVPSEFDFSNSAAYEKIAASQRICFEQMAANITEMEQDLKEVKLRDAQACFMNIARAGNKYLADTEPWKLVKTDADAVKGILFDALQICAKLAIAATPFLPHTSKKLAALLGLNQVNWQQLNAQVIIETDSQLAKPEILYKQVEDEEINKQLERLQQIKASNTQQPSSSDLAELKTNITWEDFDKLDLRVGKVIEAVKVPKADKLLNLTVDLGFEKRTILSGIAEYYQPEELIGKLVTVVANLAPRKIRGIESQGMLLMAGNDFGKLYSVSPEKEIEPGSVVK